MSQSCCTIIEACDADCVAALTCADTCVLEGENEAEVDECITSCWGGAEPPAALDAIFVCQEQSCVAACFS